MSRKNGRIPERVFDTTGNEWKIEEKQTLLGLLTALAVSKTGRTFDTILERYVEQVLKSSVESWRTAACREAASLARQAKPLIEASFLAAERNFRKEFAQSLSVHGTRLYENAVDAHLKIIKKHTPHTSGDPKRFASGIIPENTRFLWNFQTGCDTYTIYCLEQAPQRRMVYIEESGFWLAFPWIYFFVVFKNDSLWWQSENHFPSLLTFFRNSRASKKNEKLSYSNFPNQGDFSLPWICMGSLPPIRLNDLDWCNKLFDSFWNSSFKKFSDGGFGDLYKNTAKDISEVSSFEAWERVSKKNPEKIVTLPWLLADMTIDDVAKKIESVCVENSPKKDNNGENEENLKKELVAALYECLAEELFFLGSTIHFEQKIEDTLQKLTEEKISGIQEKLMRCVPEIQQSGFLESEFKKEVTYVSDLD